MTPSLRQRLRATVTEWMGVEDAWNTLAAWGPKRATVGASLSALVRAGVMEARWARRDTPRVGGGRTKEYRTRRTA